MERDEILSDNIKKTKKNIISYADYLLLSRWTE